MNYKVKEIYYTLQGEGAHAGRPAVFCRFSGCNLWSGREEDRHKAICKFCDTDFWGIDGVNGGKYSAVELAQKISDCWPDDDKGKKYVVCTGGEPLLQLDESLIEVFHQYNIEVGVETNGTIELPKGLDWVCMSPKEGSEVIVKKGNELKLVYPQGKMDPKEWEKLDFENYYLQPMDNENQDANIQACIVYCLENPNWKLSVQMHKVVGLK